MYKNYTLLVFVWFIICSCSEELVVKKSSAKAIVKFSFSQFNPIIEANVDETTKRITATLPSTADITKLSPSIIVSPGSKVSPDSDKEQDFSKEVTYTITAEDNTKIDYKVIVTQAKSNAKDILEFSFTDFTPVVIAKIDPTTKAITATLPSTADLTKLKPTIKISDKATVSPTSGNVTDFSKAVNFTVKAEDGSTQEYVATIIKEGSSSQIISIKSGKNPNNSVIYFLSSFMVYAFDPITGKKLWSFNNEGVNFSSNPTIYDGNIIVISTGIKFIDASTGVLNGEIKDDSYSYSSPVIVNNILYYGTGKSGFIKAFDLKAKKEKWSTFTGDITNVSPTIYNGNIFIGLKDEKALCAYDTETGILKWKKNNMNGVVNPCIYENLVVTGGENNLSAIDINTGTVKWEFKDGEGSNSCPTESDGIIYYGDKNTNLYAIKASDGTIKWSFKTGGKIDSSPIVYQDIVYSYSKDGYLYALDKQTGSLKWKKQIEEGWFHSYSREDSSPVVCDGVLYLMATSNNAHAINAKTGEEIWFYSGIFPNTISSPCIIDKNGKVYHSGVSGMTN